MSIIDTVTEAATPDTGIGVKESCIKLNGTVMVRDIDTLTQLLSAMESNQVRSYFNAIYVGVGWEVRFYI